VTTRLQQLTDELSSGTTVQPFICESTQTIESQSCCVFRASHNVCCELLPMPTYPPAWVGRSDMTVCLFVRALTGTRLELSTPNLVHVYSIVYRSLSACIDPQVKGQKSRSHRYEIRHGAPLLVTMASSCAAYPCATCSGCRRGSACRYDCLRFLVHSIFLSTYMLYSHVIFCVYLCVKYSGLSNFH